MFSTEASKHVALGKAFATEGGKHVALGKAFVVEDGKFRLAWSGGTFFETVVRTATNDYRSSLISTDGTSQTLATGGYSDFPSDMFMRNGFIYRCLRVPQSSGSTYYNTIFQKKELGAANWTTYQTIDVVESNRFAYGISYDKYTDTCTVSRVQSYYITDSQSKSGTVRFASATFSASNIETVNIINLSYETSASSISFESGRTLDAYPHVFSSGTAKFCFIKTNYFNGSTSTTSREYWYKNGSLGWNKTNLSISPQFGPAILFNGMHFIGKSQYTLESTPSSRIIFTEGSQTPNVAVYNSSATPGGGHSSLDGSSTAGSNFFLNGSTLVYIRISAINSTNKNFTVETYTSTDGTTFVLRTSKTSPSMTVVGSPTRHFYFGETSDKWWFTGGYYTTSTTPWSSEIVLYSVSKLNYEVVVEYHGMVDGMVEQSGFTVE